MGYMVKEEDMLSGEVRRRGPFVTEQEARMVLANAVEQAYDFNPQLAMADVRQEVEDAVRDGRKDCCNTKDCPCISSSTWMTPAICRSTR